MTLNLLAFVSSALLEIAGCFAFWMWLRQGRSPAIALLGVLSLVVFAAMLTRVDGIAGFFEQMRLPIPLRRRLEFLIERLAR